MLGQNTRLIMQLDLRAERRAGLLGRSDTLALLEIHLEKVTKQAHVPIPVVTGRRGMGRTAVLKEIVERSKNGNRPSGFGCVRSGLGQALIDATASLADSIHLLIPGSTVAQSLMDEADGFQRRSPDEATEENFVVAIDHLLYALSNAVTELPRGYVICIDDLHAANEARVEALLEGLEALSSTGAPIPVILSRAVGFGIRPLPKGLDELQLRALTNADLADLAQRKGVVATPEVIRLIGDYVEGRPGQALEIIDRAAAKGLVDAHTVRAVLAEVQSVETARTAQVEAERMAAMARTSPTAPAQVALPVAAQPVPVQPVAVQPVAVRPEPMPIVDVPKSLTVNRAQAPTITPAPHLYAAPPVVPVAPSVQVAPVAAEPAPPQPGAPQNRLGAMRPAAPVGAAAATTPNVQTAPVMQAPVMQAPVMQAPVMQTPAVAPVAKAPAKAVLLPPAHRRVLERAASLFDTEGSVRVDHLKRALGEVSRFAGAASPVSEAVLALVGDGFLNLNGPELSITASGRQYLSTFIKQ
jgi:hypothetical protein